MKYIILLGDGMSGHRLPELGGKTTLMSAPTPNMDYMASKGLLGLARTVPEGMPPGSDVANLSVLGYDPRKYYTGRAPLEAASIGVELGPLDVAYRCNLVNIEMRSRGGGKAFCPDCTMVDFTAGHITTDEARLLIKAVNEELGCPAVSFHPGVSYRHLMVWKEGKDKATCTPPHDITGKPVAPHLPQGDGDEYITDLMARSVDVLEAHPVNKARVKDGKLPANCIWLWGQGKRPALPAFNEKTGLAGAMISAVDLMKGIANIVGLDNIDVPGATGYIDTDYEGKATHAVEALGSHDFVYVHVEAPDESGHEGNIEHKLKAIADFDDKVVGTVLRAVKGGPGYRVLVMPDHPTPIPVKSHTPEPVPFVLWDSGAELEADVPRAYDEESAAGTGVMIEDGYTLMERLIKG
jgi:2,3-bisphosphoglycerate-independent phosphoglycerate mutase